MSFKAERALPGVTHIMDAMGVCMTLLEGKDRALLIDAGYGLENVRDHVQTLTDRPVSLVLTHGHHDHALGAMHFERVLIHPAEEPVYRTYTADFQRRQVLMQAAEKGLSVDEAGYLRAPVPEPEMITGGELDLGGLTARVIPCPGHTPGSLVVYVPEQRLLLTGDDWNPTTWLFFPEALPVGKYLKNMRALLEACPFERVLCSHSPILHERAELEAFFGGLTPERLRAAEPSPEGEERGIRTGRCVPAEGMQLIFDLDKYAGE